MHTLVWDLWVTPYTILCGHTLGTRTHMEPPHIKATLKVRITRTLSQGHSNKRFKLSTSIYIYLLAYDKKFKSFEHHLPISMCETYLGYQQKYNNLIGWIFWIAFFIFLISLESNFIGFGIHLFFYKEIVWLFVCNFGICNLYYCRKHNLQKIIIIVTILHTYENNQIPIVDIRCCIY